MTHLFATCGLLWVLSRKNFIPGKTPMDLLKEKIDEQKKDIKVSVCSGNVVELLSETLEEDTVKETVFEAMRRLDTGDPSRLVSFSNEMGGEPQSAATEKKEEKGSVKATFGKGKAKEKREETTKTDGEECSDEEPEEAGRHSLSDLMNKVNAMRANLKENVIGQHYAVNAFTGGYFGMELLADVDKKRKGPRGIFLFAGPPGVGKTYMAELSTFGTDIPFLRVDMSEYADKSGISNFNGIHSSYSNAHPGVVTKFVSEHPHSLLLFDEIEKACPEIIHLFLQILDAGTLQDMKWEKEISFKDTIIIFTTNAGHNLYEDVTRTNLSGISSKTVINALQSDVDPKTGR
ncbi:MAG: AAA family ATPase, partial [Clostridia bacterium]|nr:AAA family ATPase [Clostridia bacterium]